MKYTTTLNYTLPLLAAAALIVPAITHDEPTGGWSGTPAQIDAQRDSFAAGPRNPSWTHADTTAFPGCSPVRGSGVPSRLVVVTLDGSHLVVTFDDGLGKKDLWVVGYCP